jgi:iron complex outermembrane recepter protein
MTMKKTAVYSAICAAWLAPVFMQGAWAQETATSAAGGDAHSRATAPDGAASAAAPRPAAITELQTVTVTAEKRTEKINEVAGAVSAVSGDDLDKVSAKGLSDFSALVPGLQFTGSGQGYGTVTLRGIGVGSDISPLVGVVVDGVPTGSSSSFAAGAITQMDVGLTDLERVEVLRGPQGTLYGSNAVGGLISYVTRAPGLRRWEAEGAAEVSSTEGGGTNWSTRALLNAPLVKDTLGLRVSASRQHDAGWSDDPALGTRNVDGLDQTVVRASLGFKPDDRWNIRLTLHDQKLDRGGADAATYSLATHAPVDGSLDQTAARPESSHVRFDQASANVQYAFDAVQLVSLTSKSRTHSAIDLDFTGSALGAALSDPAAVGLPPTIPAAPTTGAAFAIDVDKFVQELRLVSKSTGPLQWQAGGFYTRETATNDQTLTGYLADGTANPVFDPALGIGLASVYRESAAFGNVTYAWSPALDVTAGLRQSWIAQRFTQSTAGVLLPPGALSARSSQDKTLYMLTARYHLDADSIAYARTATGYRPGGPNVSIPDVTATFKSDTLVNYELGYKTRAFDNRLDLAADVFYIDWKDIQLSGTSATGLNYLTNGGRATSQGLEVSASVLPLPGWRNTLSATFTDAKLGDAVPSLGARPGERLPNAARVSASLVSDYAFGLTDDVDGFVGGTLRHVGARESSFDASVASPQFRLDPYTALDLRAGASGDHWRLEAFVTNLTNERGQLSANTAYHLAAGEASVTLLRPRTVGLQLGFNL